MSTNYKGEADELWQVTYQHTYSTNGFSLNASKRHYCLKSGDWCWTNLYEYPLDLIGYIKKKLLKF